MSARAAFRALLRCYPAAFRQEYGGQMELAFAEQLAETRRPFPLLLAATRDALTIAPKEHWHMIHHDVRYALRTLASAPQFVAVAILSLAVGIGANIALFGLWNGVLHAPLPVDRPEELVMLSNPNAGGVSIGLNTGERNMLTYDEYQLLRDKAPAFSGLMASQAELDGWRARIDGEEEEVQGRLVSGGYFQVLDTEPLIGRSFTLDADREPAPYAVLSHDFWQTRFAGDPAVLGRTLNVANAALTIIGVMPPRFIGETAGQRPDLWVPLTMQPDILVGRQWLHDAGYDKVMWLHVFARLAPGISAQQAEAQANAVFRAGLENHYGSAVADADYEDPLDQRLVLRNAASGASTLRTEFADPLTVLLIAVGVVLLIACANLANLLLARGAARRSEIAVRLSLGASRPRLVRQLLTESLVLASLGGVAGLGLAYALHAGLVRMIAESEPGFQMSLRLDPPLLAFTLAVTLGAALLFGMLPAFQATRPLGRFAPRGHGGRALVGLQLALSLPLLLSAGLLARTLDNLQSVDLGYPSDRLLIVRLDPQPTGYDQPRRRALMQTLQAELERTPGVSEALYSTSGVFGGRLSGDAIEVEGYTPTGDDDGGSLYDMVGPGFFTRLGVPFLLGRDIDETDRTGSLPVAVINEAFAKKFFAGRNPIGQHLINVDGSERTAFEIVGVVPTVRLGRVRGEVSPYYYVPITQPLSDLTAAIFAVRATPDAGSIAPAVLDAIRRTDASLRIVWASSLEERIGEQLTQDRITARLAIAFGIVAIALAAIGLYGILTYSIVRRKNEIAVRIALGAQPARVTRMILRETVAVVAAGLALGAGLSYGATRLVASQLYGLQANDPLTISAAIAVLVCVALAAAYLPAHRASRLDPAIALRQE